MKAHPNELLIYFDPLSNSGRQTRAFAYTITKNVNEVSFEKAHFTSTQWKELLSMLNLSAKDLMNRAHPHYQAKIAGNTFGEEDWLNILKSYPYLIKAPIAIKNNRAILCINPTEIFKLT